jgi:hypothetical protein
MLKNYIYILSTYIITIYFMVHEMNINKDFKETSKNREVLLYMSFFAVLNIILLILLRGSK